MWNVSTNNLLEKQSKSFKSFSPNTTDKKYTKFNVKAANPPIIAY